MVQLRVQAATEARAPKAIERRARMVIEARAPKAIGARARMAIERRAPRVTVDRGPSGVTIGEALVVMTIVVTTAVTIAGRTAPRR